MLLVRADVGAHDGAEPGADDAVGDVEPAADGRREPVHAPRPALARARPEKRLASAMSSRASGRRRCRYGQGAGGQRRPSRQSVGYGVGLQGNVGLDELGQRVEARASVTSGHGVGELRVHHLAWAAACPTSCSPSPCSGEMITAFLVTSVPVPAVVEMAMQGRGFAIFPAFPSPRGSRRARLRW